MSENEIVKDFLVESRENLDRLDRDLVGLEKNPRDKDALAGVFRTIHTIKGTCGFLGFNKLEKVAHVGENLLSKLRDGQLLLNPEITTALLGMVDAIRQMLKEIESAGNDGKDDYPELRETLTELQTLTAAGVHTSHEAASSSVANPSDLAPTEKTSSHSKKGGRPVPLAPAKDAAGEQPASVETRVEEPARQPLADPKTRDAVPETIRVGVNLLDKLMTQVGELVLARISSCK